MSDTPTSTTGSEILDIEPTDEQLATEQKYYGQTQFKAEESTLKEKGISRGSIIMDVVKQLRTGADLFRISLPSALLAPISMLEYISYFVRPQNYILRYVISLTFVVFNFLHQKIVRSLSIGHDHLLYLSTNFVFNSNRLFQLIINRKMTLELFVLNLSNIQHNDVSCFFKVPTNHSIQNNVSSQF